MIVHYAPPRYRSRSRGRAEYPSHGYPPSYPPVSYPPGYPERQPGYPPQYGVAVDPYAAARDPYARDPYGPPPDPYGPPPHDPYALPPHDPYAPPPHDPYAPPPHDPYGHPPRDPYAPPPRPPPSYPHSYPPPPVDYPPAYPPPGYPPSGPPHHLHPPPHYPPAHYPPHQPPPHHPPPHHPPPHLSHPHPPPHHMPHGLPPHPYPPPHYPFGHQALGPKPGYGALPRSRSPNRRFIRKMAMKRPAEKPKAKAKPKPKARDGSELTPRELSDIKEAENKAKRDAHPEAGRERKPIQLLVDRASNPGSWIPCIEDLHNRSWMYMSQEKSVTQQDFQSLKDKVDWVEIQGAAVVTRKTMWFVKEGCRCPYNYGKQQVNAMTFPDWFLEMAQRWLGCLNLTDEDKDAMFPNCVNLNLYEHGDHQVTWHSDDEPLFRGKLQDTRIISVTLGAMRKFQVGLKAPRRGGILKPEKGTIATFNLGHGQVCTMEGLFQKHYLHQIAKGTTRQPRINATFRNIVEHAVGCPLRR